MSPLLASLLADHAVFRVAWTNWAEVIPGKVYRSNHPLPFRLRRAVARFGIRTVVNLRGEAPNPSTALSAAEAARLGIAHRFMAFESRGAPHRERVLRFAAMYPGLEFPILLHCKSGADRAGLASGLVRLFEGGTAAEAAAELSLRHLHFAASPTGVLDAFFFLYAEQGEGRMPFLDWVRDIYDEAEMRRRFHASRLMTLINDRLLARE
jgi:protein tyrosine phosphatase (PTP) superfamily phosphohydrolase (DUF442 family)